MVHFYEQFVDELRRNPRLALGIISGVKGSSPQKKGAKALFFPDDRIIGTLGGGCLEAEIRWRARQALASGRPEKLELTLDHDFGWDDGLICGGTVFGLILPRAAEALPIWTMLSQRDQTRTWGVREDFSIGWVTNPYESGWLYRETVSPPLALWVAGSGHIAQAVAPLACSLDFDVTVFDDRPELANPQYFPPPIHLRVGHWGELLATPLPSPPTLGLIVTRGHQHDANVLAEWIHKPFLFLGMIGSGRKARIIREGFIKKKIATAEELARVGSPVGLPIGAVSVPEIAVSILAQYIAKRAEYFSEKSISHSRPPEPALSLA
ncbi:MAG TPA: XdhC family protein [Candidatus Saccharimonadales bacterium]|nr:XdhC family protein [Candidatus Saccharimonadales bacterium]